MKLRGHLCLSVTPFSDDGSLDLDSLDSLLEHLIAGGVDGVVVLGSTGESFSVDPDERVAVVERAVAVCADRAPVIAGVAATGTDSAISLAVEAAQAGAAAVMIPPAFYAPGFFSTADGIYEHIGAVAAAVGDTDVMLYDGGGGIEIPVTVIERLAQTVSNVNMVKLTVPLPEKVSTIREVTGGRVSVLCGNDALTLYELALGVDGVTIGVGNLVPEDVTRVVHEFMDGQREEARARFYRKVLPIASIALCSTPQFVQVFKLGLQRMGVIASCHVRRPLLPLEPIRVAESMAAFAYGGLV